MFRIPTRVRMQPGCLAELPDFLAEFSAQNLLLITDQGVGQQPWFVELKAALGDSVKIDDSIQPNPRSSNIDRIADESRQLNPDAVLGIGGGSVIDAAKAVAMLLRNDGSIQDFVGKNKFTEPSAPFIAVPTTCGTGSEVTWVSVISVPEKGTKISVKGDGMFPMAAFVDADVIQSLPPTLIAATGMDAMTHSVESVIAKQANPASDALALQAVRLLIRHLGPCVRMPHKLEHRSAVMNASTIAGMSFGNSDVGAVHCLSEAIGGLLDHPHGLLNTLLLVPVLRYEFEMIRDRLKPLSASLGAPRPESFVDRLETMISSFPLASWQDLQIDPELFPMIAERAESNGSNPSNLKEMKASDYELILKSL